MRLSFITAKTIKSIILFNGMIGIIYGKSIDFYNLLGGNSVLISCFGFYDIISATIDGLNNLLIIYDSNNKIILYNLKLNIARVNSNECYPIYKIDTFPEDEFSGKKNTGNKKKNFEIEQNKKENYFNSMKKLYKLEIFKNFLILVKNNKYILIMDLNFSNKNPENNHVVFYREYLLNIKLNKDKLNLSDLVINNAKLRSEYFSEYNNELMKVSNVDKNDILFLLKISDFDLLLINFSIEKFIEKNFLLIQEYKIPTSNFIKDNNMSIDSTEEDEESKKINLNFFNLNTTKITENILKNDSKILSGNKLKENNYKNNFYYKIIYSNVDNIILYSGAIFIVFVFTITLKFYFIKKNEEKMKFLKFKIEKLEKKNLDQIVDNAELLGQEDKISGGKLNGKEKERDINKLLNIFKNKDDDKTEVNKIKSKFLNMKNYSKSEEEDMEEFCKENKYIPNMKKQNKNVKKYIKGECEKVQK